jgi:hypothetical protein
MIEGCSQRSCLRANGPHILTQAGIIAHNQIRVQAASHSFRRPDDRSGIANITVLCPYPAETLEGRQKIEETPHPKAPNVKQITYPISP